MARLVKVLAVVALVGVGAVTLAAQTKIYPPIRGQAEIGYLKPVTTVDHKAGIVKTVIKVKNLSTTGSIAGLKVDESWYNKSRNPVTGGKARLKKPLAPLEVADLVIETPRDPTMDTNAYVFSHANGTIKAKAMKQF